MTTLYGLWEEFQVGNWKKSEIMTFITPAPPKSEIDIV
jgi:hypothetical protein